MVPTVSDSVVSYVKVALFYGLTSLSMNFLNKLVVSAYSFHYPCFIMSIQTYFTLLILWIGKNLSLIKVKDYSQDIAFDFLYPSLSHALHSTLSLIALKGMNIPMYAALKRCTPLVNLFLSVVILGKAKPTVPMLISIVSITVGCLVAGVGDYDFDLYTYCMGGLSVLAQGFYLTLIQKMHSSKMSIYDMLYFNSWNTLPFFMVTSLVLGEPVDIWQQKNNFYNPGFFVSMIALSLAGSVLVYSQFLCTTVCSALTTSLVGVAKSIIQTILGFFTFGGVHFSLLNIMGLSINMCGGILYTYVKNQESKSPLLPKSVSNTT